MGKVTDLLVNMYDLTNSRFLREFLYRTIFYIINNYIKNDLGLFISEVRNLMSERQSQRFRSADMFLSVFVCKSESGTSRTHLFYLSRLLIVVNVLEKLLLFTHLHNLGRRTESDTHQISHERSYLIP